MSYNNQVSMNFAPQQIGPVQGPDLSGLPKSPLYAKVAEIDERKRAAKAESALAANKLNEDKKTSLTTMILMGITSLVALGIGIKFAKGRLKKPPNNPI